MTSTPLRIAVLFACASLAAGACSGGRTAPPSEAPSAQHAAKGVADLLAEGVTAFEESRYADAERLLRQALDAAEGSSSAASPDDRGRALAYLADTLVLSGRGLDAAQLSRDRLSDSGRFRNHLLAAGARGLQRHGRLEPALELLGSASTSSPSEQLLPAELEIALLRGELLIEQGKRDEAVIALQPIIEAYNGERIAESDGRSLAVVGRAAHLLRSPHDANDAFDEAEQATPGDVRTLLWRAELYLDKYDIAHADEVVTEALERAPHHPAALVWKAHVRLAQALDFDEAERLATAALRIDETLTDAYFVLAGIALRDEEIERAEQHITRGLRHNPRALDLLGMHATARFLADDEAGFEQAVEQVLGLNPQFTRLFQIVGEYADWEHRYDEIVQLMRRAVRIDPEDGRARAQLGLNLIRAGNDAAGVVELRRAFQADPFNVRVYNTLELYEKIIPRDYEQVRSGHFAIRYPKRERALLERYVPDLLERAFRTMAEHYGFEPEAPIGIELYETREQFAVRTSGLPQTAIQGVCFGRTLATLSLSEEPANLGMTLWHELAHVFHIQLSKSRVPRWFTEGVAELETARERPEWSRELDPQLYQALRADRLPRVVHMSRAFTRAEHMEDVATAYYASNQIATYLADRYGMGRLANMLRAWGQGRSSSDVISEALGVSPADLDSAFKKHLQSQLSHFDAQFVPRRWRGGIAERRQAATSQPNDPDAQLAYALALHDLGRVEDAEQRIRAILKKAPQHAEARLAQARISFAKGDKKAATEQIESLLRDGHDGYEPRLLAARLALARDDKASAQDHLSAAHRFDPRAADPLVLLAELHRRGGNGDGELDALDKLAPLEEHAAAIHRRRLELLVQRERWDEAVAAGEAALWSDLSDGRIHTLFARALEATGQRQRALFELESATLCPGAPADRAAAFRKLADAYARQGQTNKARAAQAEADRLSKEPAAPQPSTPD